MFRRSGETSISQIVESLLSLTPILLGKSGFNSLVPMRTHKCE